MSKKPPLIIFDGKSKERKLDVAIIIIGLILGSSLYFAGSLTTSYVLSFLGLFVAGACLIVGFFIRRKVRLQEGLQQGEIDESVKRYKQDLVDTLYGYDLDYEPEDVKEAAAEYRRKLEEDRTSITLFDPSAMWSVLFKKDKSEKSEKKKRRLR